MCNGGRRPVQRGVRQLHCGQRRQRQHCQRGIRHGQRRRRQHRQRCLRAGRRWRPQLSQRHVLNGRRWQWERGDWRVRRAQRGEGFFSLVVSPRPRGETWRGLRLRARANVGVSFRTAAIICMWSPCVAAAGVWTAVCACMHSHSRGFVVPRRSAVAVGTRRAASESPPTRRSCFCVLLLSRSGVLIGSGSGTERAPPLVCWSAILVLPPRLQLCCARWCCGCGQVDVYKDYFLQGLHVYFSRVINGGAGVWVCLLYTCACMRAVTPRSAVAGTT